MISDDDGTMSTYQSHHSVLFVSLDAHINLILASFGIFQATVLEIAHEPIHVKFCSSVLQYTRKQDVPWRDVIKPSSLREISYMNLT